MTGGVARLVATPNSSSTLTTTRGDAAHSLGARRPRDAANARRSTNRGILNVQWLIIAAGVLVLLGVPLAVRHARRTHPHAHGADPAAAAFNDDDGSADADVDLEEPQSSTAVWWRRLPGAADMQPLDSSTPPPHLPPYLQRAHHSLMSPDQLRAAIKLAIEQRAPKGATSGAVAAARKGEKKSRGILVVGSQWQLANAYINLRVLRERLKCSLPAEVVWHGFTEAPPAKVQAALRSIPGVTLIDSSRVKPPPPLEALAANLPARLSYGAKVYALAFVTSFDEVLLLDSDNLPLADPEALFDTPAYRRHGSLFWPDWWGGGYVHPTATSNGVLVPRVSPELYAYFGLRPPWVRPRDPREHGAGATSPTNLTAVAAAAAAAARARVPWNYAAAESGQALVDRARHLDVLVWTWWLMRQWHLAQLVHGDKDMFRLAFSLAGKARRYQQVEVPARAAVAKPRPNKSHLFLGMVQLTPEGQPMFHHRTGISKFAHQSFDLRDKLDDKRVAYLTPPLPHRWAVYILEWWGLEASAIDLDPWDQRRCALLPPSTPSNSANDSTSGDGASGNGSSGGEAWSAGGGDTSRGAGALLDVPGAWCQDLEEPRIPLWPLERFGARGRVIDDAHRFVQQLAQSTPW